MSQLGSKLITRGIPTVAVLGLSWLAARILSNETRLLVRKLELEDALATNAWEKKRRLLRGK